MIDSCPICGYYSIFDNIGTAEYKPPSSVWTCPVCGTTRIDLNDTAETEARLESTEFGGLPR